MMPPDRVRKVWAAATSFPNTPETDKQAEVWHDVDTEGMNGEWYERVRVMATDPVHAMRKVGYMPEAEYMALERVKSRVWRGA